MISARGRLVLRLLYEDGRRETNESLLQLNSLKNRRLGNVGRVEGELVLPIVLSRDEASFGNPVDGVHHVDQIEIRVRDGQVDVVSVQDKSCDTQISPTPSALTLRKFNV